MRNIVLTEIEGRADRAASLAASWGGVPLYCFVLLQGLPLGRRLIPARTRLDQDLQQQLVERVTTVGATQSLLPALTWMVVYAGACLLLSREHSRPWLRRLTIKQWPLIAMVVFSAATALWSPNTSQVLASSFHAIGTTAIAMAAAIRCSNELPSFLRALSVAFTVNLLAHLICVLAAPGIGIALDGRWMGMSTHSNTLGGYAWLAVWASMMAVLANRGRSRLIAAGGFIFALAMLAGSGSTTSMVVTAITIMFLLYLTLSSQWMRASRQLGNVAVICIFLGISVVTVAYGDAIDAFTGGLGKSSSFTGRDIIWRDAMQLIALSPWIGWGFDDNARVIVETGFNHASYHNGYLDLGVRGGVAALALMGVAILLTLKGMLQRGRAWLMIVLPFLTAFLIYNMMEATLFSPRSSVWLIMATVMLATPLMGSRAIVEDERRRA